MPERLSAIRKVVNQNIKTSNAAIHFFATANEIGIRNSIIKVPLIQL